MKLNKQFNEIVKKYLERTKVKVKLYDSDFIQLKNGTCAGVYYRTQDEILISKRSRGRMTMCFILMHQLSHSTGHKSRLDRSFIFYDYDKEQMIAHITSLLVFIKCGVSKKHQVVKNIFYYIKLHMNNLQDSSFQQTMDCAIAQSIIAYKYITQEEQVDTKLIQEIKEKIYDSVLSN